MNRLIRQESVGSAFEEQTRRMDGQTNRKAERSIPSLSILQGSDSTSAEKKLDYYRYVVKTTRLSVCNSLNGNDNIQCLVVGAAF